MNSKLSSETTAHTSAPRLGLTLGLVLFVGLALQATLVHSVVPTAIAPDILVILAVYLGLYLQNPLGVVLVFLLGVCGDFASGQFVGPQAGGLVIAYSLVVIFAGKVYAERGVALGLLAFIASIAKSAFLLGMLVLYVNDSYFTYTNIQSLLIEAALSGLIAPLLLHFISICSATKRSGQRRVQWSQNI